MCKRKMTSALRLINVVLLFIASSVIGSGAKFKLCISVILFISSSVGQCLCCLQVQKASFPVDSTICCSDPLPKAISAITSEVATFWMKSLICAPGSIIKL
ncbi:hypothetical protein XELAEV_18022782mg [Xenopus laevis]|uniref:Uncharacterized protein n=1 Tax=Xenopus laevis TaxID=8355 RepID=A0A974D346_XENLA|nr:hypothetical protein XELAEV_18022782mg [Xenopus laevis]